MTDFVVRKFVNKVHVCTKFHENWKGWGFFCWFGMECLQPLFCCLSCSRAAIIKFSVIISVICNSKCSSSGMILSGSMSRSGTALYPFLSFSAFSYSETRVRFNVTKYSVSSISLSHLNNKNSDEIWSIILLMFKYHWF